MSLQRKATMGRVAQQTVGWRGIDHAALFIFLTTLLLTTFSANARADASSGVCARVKLQLQQDAFLTRTGYKAKLEVSNDSTSAPVTNISAQVTIYDSLNNVATSLFGLQGPTLDNLSDVSGNGTLPTQQTGSASWLIIPSDEAAPLAPTRYFVGGQFSYTFQGKTVSQSLEPVGITVSPDAKLHLSYFLQRDVIGDDPWTDNVKEASQPFYLALMVYNDGAGTAKYFRVTTAQPKIVDNKKGLLVDFKIIGATVDGVLAQSSLTLNFGDVNPNQRRIGIWSLESTLQGNFIDYSASLEYVTTLGNAKLSAVKSVEIHEMSHLVQAQGDLDDGAPDFLVNDIPDPFTDATTYFAVPDTVYLSNGGIRPVSLISNATVSNTVGGTVVQTTVTANVGSGFNYIRLPDPSAGGMKIAKVVGSDGREIIVGRNAWQTDRTFIANSRRPRMENILHLFDNGGTGIYTITFEIPGVDLIPPSSAVDPLPPTSATSIPVTWTGTDNVGVTSYDIYVSLNDGPFSLWLSGTKSAGAVYSGISGSKYAFYSIAYDAAGNKEAPPASPDAITTVAQANLPPHFTRIGNLDSTIPSNLIFEAKEGESLRISLEATDPDGDPRQLTYSLPSGTAVPPGLTVDSSAAQLTWNPGAGTGGKTYSVTLNVVDTGVPQGRDQITLSFTIDKSTSPPVFDALPTLSGMAGQVLAGAIHATDPNGLTLSYSIISGAPTGMTLDPSTGSVSWTPLSGQIGSYSITVRAADGREQTDAQFSIFVRPQGSIERWISTKTGFLPANIEQALSQDRDGDGKSLLMEYAFGTDPLVLDRPRISVQVVADGTSQQMRSEATKGINQTTQSFETNGANRRMRILARVRTDDPDLIITASWSKNLICWQAVEPVRTTTVADGDSSLSDTSLSNIEFDAPEYLIDGTPEFFVISVELTGATVVDCTETYVALSQDLGAKNGDVRYVPLHLSNPILASGTIGQLFDHGFAFDGTTWPDGKFNKTATDSYEIEFISGVNIATRKIITSNNTSSLLYQAPNLNGLAQGDTFVIRHRLSFNDILAASQFVGILSGPNPSSADQLAFWNSDTQLQQPYFLSSVPGHLGWFDLAYSPVYIPLESTPQAMIMTKHGDSQTRFYETGVLAWDLPESVVPAGLSLWNSGALESPVGIGSMNLECSGFTGGETADESDQVIVILADGTMHTYWLFCAAGASSWFDENSKPADNVTFDASSAFFIKRKGTTGFTWLRNW